MAGARRAAAGILHVGAAARRQGERQERDEQEALHGGYDAHTARAVPEPYAASDDEDGGLGQLGLAPLEQLLAPLARDLAAAAACARSRTRSPGFDFALPRVQPQPARFVLTIWPPQPSVGQGPSGSRAGAAWPRPASKLPVAEHLGRPARATPRRGRAASSRSRTRSRAPCGSSTTCSRRRGCSRRSCRRSRASGSRRSAPCGAAPRAARRWRSSSRAVSTRDLAACRAACFQITKPQPGLGLATGHDVQPKHLLALDDLAAAAGRRARADHGPLARTCAAISSPVTPWRDELGASSGVIARPPMLLPDL